MILKMTDHEYAQFNDSEVTPQLREGFSLATLSSGSLIASPDPRVPGRTFVPSVAKMKSGASIAQLATRLDDTNIYHAYLIESPDGSYGMVSNWIHSDHPQYKGLSRQLSSWDEAA